MEEAGGGDRQPEVDVHPGKRAGEPAGSDADDREVHIVQPDRTPENRRVRRKMPPPEPVARDDDRRFARRREVRHESLAESWAHAEHPEVVPGDDLGRRHPRDAALLERHGLHLLADELRERRRVRAEELELLVRRRAE
jgi:hypothetical protein